MNGANYESDASELNTENVEPMDISPPESSNMELSPKIRELSKLAQNNLDMFFNVAEPSQRFIFIYFVNFSVVNYFQ